MKVAIKQNGMPVVLDDENGAYHVLPRSEDPWCKYDVDEVLAHAAAHPEDVLPEGSSEEGGFWYPPEPEPVGTHKKVGGSWVTDSALASARLAARIAEMCLALDNGVSPEVLLDGFTYQGVRIQADPVAQQNATGFLTAVAAGVPIPFPVEWRTKANEIYQIQDFAALQGFATAMLTFVQAVFHAKWRTKDSVRAAQTEAEAKAAYAAGLDYMKHIGDAK